MTGRLPRISIPLIALTTLTMGCEGATRPSAIVIPGPAVPTPQPTPLRVVPLDELASGQNTWRGDRSRSRKRGEDSPLAQAEIE